MYFMNHGLMIPIRKTTIVTVRAIVEGGVDDFQSMIIKYLNSF